MIERLIGKAGFDEWKIERIGNILDIHTQICSSAYTLFKKGVSGKYRRILLSLLYRLHRYSMKGLIIVSGTRELSKTDSIGYPQGYGCIAFKKEGTKI